MIAARLKSFITGRSLWIFLGCVAAIAIVSFAYFYPDAAEGNQLRQHDMQQGIAIGQEVKAFTESTGQTSRWTNSLFSGMPNFQIAPDYPSSHMFTWINTVMGLGLPYPANLLAMMMLGFFILLMVMRMRWWVSLIGAVAYGFSSYFVILIAAGHIWKFSTLAYIPPTIAGIVLCYRGRYLAGATIAALFAMMQISANHVQMTYYFLPVVAGFMLINLIESYRSGEMRRWGIATGSLAIAAVLAVGANSPSLYNTYEYSKETIRGGHSELSRGETTSPNTSAGLDRDYITQYSYTPSETFTLLIPNVKGGASAKPEKGSGKPMTLYDLPETREMMAEGKIDDISAQYLQYMSQYFGGPEGTNGPVYVGALIFALFLMGCVVVKGPAKWVLLTLTVLSIGLAWGRYMMWLTDLFIDWVPMYSKFRTVESILVVAQFTMPLLAMMALQRFVSAGDKCWERYRKPLLWSFGISLALCMMAIVAPGFYGSVIGENDRMIDGMIADQLTNQGYDAQTARMFSLESPSIYAAVTTLRHSLIADDGMRSFLIVAAGLGVMLLYARRKLNAAIMAAGIGIIVCADLFMVNKRYLDHDSFVPRRLTTGAPIAMTDADRAILTDTTMNYRVMDIPRFTSADPSYYHKAIGGYHAAKLTRYQDLIDCHLGHFLSGQADDADMEVLNMLNARYVVSYDGQPILNHSAMGNAWMVDQVKYVTDPDNEMAALSHIDLRREAVADGRFHSILGESTPRQPGDTIFETSYAPNRLTYHARSAKGGVAVFSEIYFPWGWHASIDGQPAQLGRTNYVLRALKIPAGNHTIEMWFDPQSLHTTAAISRVCIILIYLAAAAAVIIALCGGCRRKKHAA